jgi:hypothetical protein
MGIIEIITAAFIVLKLAGVGACENWDIIAWPWHWSCLCLEIWVLLVYIAIAVIAVFLKGVAQR